ncbi:MAG: branched-chain amino acid ABC transporter substrate-binding protein [Pseudomonadota bacterium]
MSASYRRSGLAGSAVISLALLSSPSLAENVRVAFIDPLSGTFAALGQNELQSFQAIAARANQEKWAGDNQLEFVGFDNQASPQVSLVQLKNAIDQGFRYITQANGSGAALALIDAINKHNERNPGKEVMFLNHGAVDPSLTNDKCSFWHFRFDANADMKSQALVSHIAANPAIKKIYIINQDYAAGHQFTRGVKEYLKSSRGDLQLVGEDLVPLGKVKDFSPYVAKIKASGADGVVTGNWGTDLSLLIKAAKEAGLTANFYTYYANLKGSPAAMGADGADRVRYVGIWNINNENFLGEDIAASFKQKYNDDFTWMVSYSIVTMFSKAIKESGSADPVKVGFALEGMKAKSLNGQVEMRASDHQLLQPLYIATWTKTDGKTVKYDQEGTGYGWKTEKRYEASSTTQPTTCDMKRPPRS